MGSMRLGSKAIHAFWDEAHAMAMSYKSTIQAEVKDTRSFVSKNKTRAPFLGDSFEAASRQAGRDFKSVIKSDLSTNSIPTLELNPKSGQYMNKGKSSFNHRVEGTTNNYEIGVTNKEPSTAVQEQKKLLTDLNPSSGTYLQNNKGLSTSTEVPGFTGTHKLPSKVKEASVSQEIPEDLLKPVTGSPVGSAAFATTVSPLIGSLPNTGNSSRMLTGALKRSLKNVTALSGALTTGLVLGSALHIGGDFGSTVLLNMMSQPRLVSIGTSLQHASPTNTIAKAAKSFGISDPSQFASDLEKASKGSDMILPASGTRSEILDIRRKFLLEMYKSGDEQQYLNLAVDRNTVVTSEGLLDPIFLEGVSKYAPKFASKYGLSSYRAPGAQGKLESVNINLQNIYKQAMENYNGKLPKVTQGNRFADYQHNLYKQGRIGKNGKFKDPGNSPITYADGYIYRSDHQGANAIDIVLPGGQNKAEGAEKTYGAFNNAMQKAVKDLKLPYDIEWGGTYSNGDYGHFSLKSKIPQHNVVVQQPNIKKMHQDSFGAILKDTFNSYQIPNANLLRTGYLNARSAYIIGNQILDRKLAPVLGMEKKDAAIKPMNIINSKSIDIKNVHNDAVDRDNVYYSQIQNLNDVSLGYRNRGDYSGINSKSGITLTTYEGFIRPSEQAYKNTSTSRTPYNISDKQGVIGLDDTGRFVKGTFGDFKTRGDVRITPMPFNKISSFEELNGSQVYKNKAGFKKSAFFPVTNNIDDSGKTVKGSLPFVVGNKDPNRYGKSDGGRIIFENPDTKQTYLVSGSFQEVKDAFSVIKGKSQYVNSWLLDTGTYVRGLSKKNGILGEQDLRDFDNLNLGGGGNGLYVKD